MNSQLAIAYLADLAAMATPPELKKPTEPITCDLVNRLGFACPADRGHERHLDWSLPEELPETAVLDGARTVCRRAEWYVVRLVEKDTPCILKSWFISIASPTCSGCWAAC
ncbi:MAG: hypothetical protein DMG06_04940 [Acidobacteria bacterium]|nr:MAG: hypothetical protein DMG06_04940 [Acidobacteriota bacterium]